MSTINCRSALKLCTFNSFLLSPTSCVQKTKICMKNRCFVLFVIARCWIIFVKNLEYYNFAEHINVRGKTYVLLLIVLWLIKLEWKLYKVKYTGTIGWISKDRLKNRGRKKCSQIHRKWKDYWKLSLNGNSITKQIHQCIDMQMHRIMCQWATHFCRIYLDALLFNISKPLALTAKWMHPRKKIKWESRFLLIASPINRDVRPIYVHWLTDCTIAYRLCNSRIVIMNGVHTNGLICTQ